MVGVAGAFDASFLTVGAGAMSIGTRMTGWGAGLSAGGGAVDAGAVVGATGKVIGVIGAAGAVTGASCAKAVGVDRTINAVIALAAGRERLFIFVMIEINERWPPCAAE